MAVAAFPASNRRVVRPVSRHGERIPVAPAKRHRNSIYWHRRFVVLAVALIVVLVIRVLVAQLGGGPLATFGPGGPLGAAPAGHVVYVVQPGDTLWKIATQMDGHGDPRPVVDSLVRQLHGAQLQIGQRINLPASPLK